MNEKGISEFDTVDGSNLRVGIVVSRFNANVTGNLLEGAKQELARHHVPSPLIDTFFVSGAFEIPLVLRVLAKTSRYEVLVALGCVVRGETPHFDFICHECASNISRIMLDHSIPIGFGLLTCDTMDQAVARAQSPLTLNDDQAKVVGTSSNKGIEAVQAAIESWSVINGITGVN